MSEYKRIDVLKYVQEGLKNGTLVPRKAEKFARISARRGIEGEKVISWSVDSDGNEVKEKVATVEKDENGKLGMVATKLNENLEVVVDNNGHINEWIIDDATFTKKYESDSNGTDVYKPKGGVQTFVQINEDITIFQWGEEMTIAKGGYINITNLDDVYAISKRDFEDTYKFVDEEAKAKKLS